MSKDNEPHIHLHVHEGASADAVRAAAEALVRGQAEPAVEADEPPLVVDEAPPELDEKTKAEYTRRAYVESGGKAKPLMEFLADNPERLIPFAEVSEHLELESSRSLPGLLGSFSRRSRHRYEGYWPFGVEDLGTPGEEQWHLVMKQNEADIINGLR